MVAVLQKAAQGFRIPIRTARLVFTGDYLGAEVVVRLDVPVSTFLTIQDMVASDQQLKVFELFGDQIVQSWNLEDDDGIPHPPTGLGMNRIPIQLANMLLEQWVEAATQPSLPLG